MHRAFLEARGSNFRNVTRSFSPVLANDFAIALNRPINVVETSKEGIGIGRINHFSEVYEAADMIVHAKHSIELARFSMLDRSEFL